MYNEFYDIESLFDAVSKDRVAEGVTAIVQNRYPIRFVLFDNVTSWLMSRTSIVRLPR